MSESKNQQFNECIECKENATRLKVVCEEKIYVFPWHYFSAVRWENFENSDPKIESLLVKFSDSDVRIWGRNLIYILNAIHAEKLHAISVFNEERYSPLETDLLVTNIEVLEKQEEVEEE